VRTWKNERKAKKKKRKEEQMIKRDRRRRFPPALGPYVKSEGGGEVAMERSGGAKSEFLGKLARATNQNSFEQTGKS